MGKNCHVIFAQEMHEVVKRQMALERDLADVFANREFFIVYQPIVDLETGLPRDVEALLRWRHPGRGVVGPVELIPVLETSDLMIDVGRSVLMERAARSRLGTTGVSGGHICERGRRQLRHDVLIDHVRETLGAASLDASYLTLEVTDRC